MVRMGAGDGASVCGGCAQAMEAAMQRHASARGMGNDLNMEFDGAECGSCLYTIPGVGIWPRGL